MFNRSINSPHPSSGIQAGSRNDTEQAILEAAERLFLEKGYARTSTTEIARAAGCNQALVHYYFRTKDNLFESIFERKVLMLFGSARRIQEKDASFEERLAARVEAHFDLLAANPGIPPLVFSELLTNPARIQSLRARMGDAAMEILGAWKKEFDAEVRKGTVRPMEMIDLLLTIFSVNVAPFLLGPVLRTATGMPDGEYQRIMERRRKANVRIVLESIRPDPADGASSAGKAKTAAKKRRLP